MACRQLSGDSFPWGLYLRVVPEQVNLTAKYTARGVDFLNCHLGAIQVIGIVGNAIGRRERRWNADQELVISGGNHLGRRESCSSTPDSHLQSRAPRYRCAGKR